MPHPTQSSSSHPRQDIERGCLVVSTSIFVLTVMGDIIYAFAPFMHLQASSSTNDSDPQPHQHATNVEPQLLVHRQRCCPYVSQ